jgi:flavorubredoxin
MDANRACHFWVNMIRGLDVDSIVPQHGRAMKGK